MYTFCIVVILLASVSLIFVVLVQSPKGGMAANFGAANQVMGVRDAANGLEKFTWAMALVIVVLSLVATLSMDKGTVAASNKDLEKDANALIEMTQRLLSCRRRAGGDPCFRAACRGSAAVTCSDPANGKAGTESPAFFVAAAGILINRYCISTAGCVYLPV